MTGYNDSHGMAHTAASAASVQRFEAVIPAFMGFRRDLMKQLAAVLEADPEMPMANCAKGYFMKMSGMKQLTPIADEQLALLAIMAAAGRLNARERMHHQALRQWCAGDMDGATGTWEQILLTHPLDGLALRLAHFTHFYSGDGRKIRDSMARALPNWPDDHPCYGYLLGMYGFGLEEAGDYAGAERYGRRAVEINPEDAWSVHTVAHCMEMTERHAEGIEWTRSLEPSWSRVNNFRYHLHWHRGLYHLERGEIAEVLDLYDNQFGKDVDTLFYLDMVNATSMLWRLEMFGTDVGDRWQTLAEVARKHIPDDELVFVSLHYLMALVSAGGKADIEAMMAHLEEWAARPTTQGRVTAQAGLNLARGMRELRRRNYDKAVKEMLPVRYAIDPLGGSHAQRDVFWMMLTDAAAKGSDPDLALSLFAERTARKPHSAWGWEHYADCLVAAGLGDRAKMARETARKLIVH
jgi:tetratricopeptide (TPR) repeat protein